MDTNVIVEIDGTLMTVRRGQQAVNLPGGRRAVLNWGETFPETYLGHQIEEPTTPKVLWRGTLATGGRAPEEFAATIVDGPSGPAILRRKGLGQEEVSCHQIRAEYWLRALAELAQRA